MQPVREAGSDPAFLRKALGEAAGEARRLLEGLPRRFLLRKGEGWDEDWCLLAIAVHLRDVERGFVRQVEAFFEHDHPRLEHVDVDDIPAVEDYEGEDDDDVLEEWRYLRRHTTYLLWGLLPSDWDRTADHPYRGPVSLLDVARAMYEHDLEHLWQARRMLDWLERSR